MQSNIARYGESAEWLEPAGHPKSALFARLLEGKEALLYPPPRFGSYPWYQVIETPGPHAVNLETRSIIQSGMHQARVKDSLNGVMLIEDSLWRICDQNEAASKLISILKSITDGQNFNTLNLNSESYKRLLNCLKESPEWIVRFGEWPEHRLYMGRTIMTSSKWYAFKKEIDLNQLGGGHPKILKTHVANPNFSDPTKYINFGQSKIANYFSWLENILNSFRKMMLFDSDWIEYECDAWVVERV
jgi:hypothetical protein